MRKIFLISLISTLSVLLIFKFINLEFLLFMPIFLGFFVFPGIFLTLIFFKESPTSEKVILTFLLSTGINTYLFLILGFINFLTGQNLALASIILNFSLFFIYLRKAERMDISKLKLNPFKILSLSFISLILLSLLYTSLHLPFLSWDTIASFNYWAEMLVSLGGFRGEVFMGYPPLFYFSISWVYLLSGSFNQHMARMIPLAFGFMVLVISYNMSSKFKIDGLLTLLFFIALPESIIYLSIGYADMPATFYLLCGIYFVMLFSENLEKKYLYLAGLSSGLSLFTKQTPVLLVVAISFYLFLMLKGKISNKRALRLSLFLLSISLLIALPWYLRVYSISPKSYVLKFQEITSFTYLWGEELSESYTKRISLALKNLLEFYTLPLGIIFFAGFLYTLRMKDFRLINLTFILPWLFIWTFFASFGTRYLIYITPLITLSASKITQDSLKAFKKLRGQREQKKQFVLIILTSFLFLTSFILLLNLAGHGISQIKSVREVKELKDLSDDEIRVEILGDAFKVLSYVENEEKFFGKLILTPDSRMPALNPSFKQVYPKNFKDLKYADFLVVSDWMFKRRDWRASEVGEEIASGKLQHFSVEREFKGYTLYRVEGGGWRSWWEILSTPTKFSKSQLPFMITN
ncbi:MAG: ArnT family glycosyltransferase [Candidatus Methanofastidiosia archaeon]